MSFSGSGTFSLSSMGYRSPLALWSEGVMSNQVLLDEVCDSAHLGIDEGDIVPEVEVTKQQCGGACITHTTRRFTTYRAAQNLP